MSETLTQEQEVIVTAPNPFDTNSWSETPVVEEAKPAETNTDAVVETKPDAAAAPADTPAAVDDVLDSEEWLKKEFGWDNIQTAKTELEDLRKLRETAATKEEIKFANEQSEKIFKALQEGGYDDVLYEHLDTKKKLAKVPDMNAIDALKLKIQLEHKDYTAADINDIIEERYEIPEKPVQGDIEEDAAYEARVAKWQTNVERTQRRIERDALEAKQSLAKLNTELVLPDIKPKEVQPTTNQPDQKELDRLAKVRENFLAQLEGNYKNFNGYEVRYKDEEVEIPATFAVSDEEKMALKEELKDFDVEGFILSRWFGKEGEPNVTQMMEDVTLLRKKGDIMQKFANEIGTKMKEHYIKVKANVTIGNQHNTLQPNTPQGDLQNQIAYIWNNG